MACRYIFYWNQFVPYHNSCLYSLVFKCLHGFAPRYVAELCVPVPDVMGRRNLRSATRGLLNFPGYNMTSYGRRAFRYAGPHAWNSLPLLKSSIDVVCRKCSGTARTFATNHINRTFQALSKNVLIRADSTLSALETFHVKWAIQVYSFTYLFTYSVFHRQACRYMVSCCCL